MPEKNFQAAQRIHGFRCERVEDVPELRSRAFILTHERTGARLVHLFNEDPNNLFSIAFRTPVHDNTGVPHILEHSVLCGSRKFPLKDPFQELLKGSLQTFLNAMTYPDKTVYPVSSQVEVDFFNLVDVYCDAVFHPLLSENTFYQEGWHFDLEGPRGPVTIKGIVYNEMKGVFSDFSSHVSRKVLSGLLPDTTYFFESGGEPEHITDLSYQCFREFHAKYYHPSNAFIFLYGNIPTKKTLRFLEAEYLSAFNRISLDSRITHQISWDRPGRMEIEGPAPREDAGTATVAVTWLLGHNTDPLESLSCGILARYLMGTEGSPLKRALIDSGLGEDLDDISGFDADLIQGMFSVGLRKSHPENAEKIKSIIFETLDRQCRQGLDEDLLEGSIRRMEFSLKEISGGAHFPYNLKLAERCYRSWIYGGDPLAHLQFEKTLEWIKAEKKKGQDFFRDKIREGLLENPHHLLSIVKASPEMGARLEKLTERQSRRLTRDFGPEQKQACHALTLRLLEEQKNPVSPEIKSKIPRLSKSDLPARGIEAPTREGLLSGIPVFTHPLFTSGIVYLNIGFDCGVIPGNLLLWLPLYSELMTRCGAGGRSYEDFSKRVSLATGGLSSSLSCQTKTDRPDAVFKFFLSAKVLPERFSELEDILSNLFSAPELDNTKHLKDILLEMRNGLHASVINSGHSFAISHASAKLSLSRYVNEQLNGISQLRFLDALVQRNDLKKMVEKMQSLHSLLMNRNQCLVSLTANDPSVFLKSTESIINHLPDRALRRIPLPFKPEHPASICGIEVNTSVNFLAKTWRLEGMDARDLGHFFLLSKNLSTGFLWDKVRVEGGAYGGMASTSSAHPVFSCASYRDPNLLSTLKNFDKGLEEVAGGIDKARVDQSIIGAIGLIDKPKSPMGKGFGETLALLSGRTPAFRQGIREAILSAGPEDLRERARELLGACESVITVIGSPSAFDAARKEGSFIKREPLLPPS